MESSERTKKLMIISERLLLFATLSLMVTGTVFALALYYDQRLMISWLSFECGIIGGFVSIQQRLRKIEDEELALLAESWAMILIIPIYGGIFALVLYLLFLSGLLSGHLFPKFSMLPFSEFPRTDEVLEFLKTTYPSSGQDLAKLLFWTFVAGFSERFVPQIIQQVSSQRVEQSSKDQDSSALTENQEKINQLK